MKHPKNILRFGAFLGLSVLAASCGRDLNDPGVQYAPEMYESIPYDPYKQVRDSVTPFANQQSMQAPPVGSVPRGGFLEGFEFAEGDSIRKSEAVSSYPNPVPYSDVVLAEGEVLYQRFCAVCHGVAGKGDGSITKNPAIKPQAYDSDMIKNYTDGRIYYTIVYGLNNMGSYVSQIDYLDRWKIVHFVKTLQGRGNLEKAAPSFKLAEANFDAMTVGDRYQLTEVYFNPQDSTLRKDSKKLLDGLADFMSQHASLKLEIGGHTDADGDDAANMALSRARAAAVVAYLADKGVDAARLTATGYGETKPIAANDTPANKQLNRRTELKVNEK
jgi:outer membrane protein OmpA-like peptidoglycan-associated protein